MEHKIVEYVNLLFQDLKQTDALEETKEELIINLTEKYHDLIAEGNSHSQAYKSVIASIGDIDELVEVATKASHVEQKVEVNIINSPRNNAVAFLILGIILTIASPVPMLILAGVDNKLAPIGVGVLLLIVAIAIGMFVYAFYLHRQSKQTTVEQPAPRVTEQSTILTDSDQRKRGQINKLVYLIATILFFTGIYHYRFSFLIFIAAYGVTKIIELAMVYTRLQRLNSEPAAYMKEEIYHLVSTTIWTIAVILFFVNPLQLNISWIVFLVAAACNQIIKIVIDLEETYEKN